MSQADNESKKQLNSYLKYSSLAIQMGVVVSVFVWIGVEVDKKIAADKPWGVLAFSIVGIGSALYLALKDFINPKQ